ncbi:MAG: hypothetical protein IPK64_18365 [bacterium]|nr:hypothetical protein [bacterium]
MTLSSGMSGRWLAAFTALFLVGCATDDPGLSPSPDDPVSAAIAPLFATPVAEVDSQLVAETVASLAATNEFASVRMGRDNTTIEFIARDGRVLYVDYYVPDLPEIPDPGSDLEIAADGAGESEFSRSPKDEIVIGAPTALIFAPGDEGANLEKLREILVSDGLQVDVVRGSDCTLDALDRKLRSGYGVVVFITHGGSSPDHRTYLALGEVFDPNDPTYLLLPDAQRAGVNRYVRTGSLDTFEEQIACFRSGTGSGCQKTRFAVDERFFAGYTFPRSIIFLGACNSYVTDNLPNILRSRGASAVIGWDMVVNPVLNYRTIRQFLWQLGLPFSTTVRGAIEACKSDFKLICPFLGLAGHLGDVSGLVGGPGDGNVFMSTPVPVVTPLGGRYSVTLVDWNDQYRPTGTHAQRYTIDIAVLLGGVVTGSVRVFDSATGVEQYQTSIANGHLSGVNLKIEIPREDGSTLVLSGRNGFEMRDGDLRPSFSSILGTSWYVRSEFWGGCSERGTWAAVAGEAGERFR